MGGKFKVNDVSYWVAGSVDWFGRKKGFSTECDRKSVISPTGCDCHCQLNTSSSACQFVTSRKQLMRISSQFRNTAKFAVVLAPIRVFVRLRVNKHSGENFIFSDSRKVILMLAASAS